MGWGGSCRDGVGDIGVGWGGWGVVCNVAVGWGGVGYVRVVWVIQWWSGLRKVSLNNLSCHKLGVVSFLLTNYCKLLSG